jgi:hypothetical protein
MAGRIGHGRTASAWRRGKAGRVADSATVLNAMKPRSGTVRQPVCQYDWPEPGPRGWDGHSEVSTPETQHYVVGRQFVSIQESTGYGQDFRDYESESLF